MESQGEESKPETRSDGNQESLRTRDSLKAKCLLVTFKYKKQPGHEDKRFVNY